MNRPFGIFARFAGYDIHWLPRGKVLDTKFRLQAVIFDLDGLVLDSERCYFRCWRRAAADLGFELNESQYAELAGIPNPQAEKMLASLMGEGFPMARFSSSG